MLLFREDKLIFVNIIIVSKVLFTNIVIIEDSFGISIKYYNTGIYVSTNINNFLDKKIN